MLTYDDHFSVLQSALEFQSKIDGNIHFFCSDGKIEVRSTHLKVHSKLLSQIIPNNAQFEELKASANGLTVLLPDVKKSHIAHLMNLITFGKIQFSVTKLDEIVSFQDVINDVLSTADLLDINITNYGLDPEENPGNEKDLQQTEKGDKSVVKDSREIEEILISDEDNPAPSNGDEPTDKATFKEQNKNQETRNKKRKRKENAENVLRTSSKTSCFICNEEFWDSTGLKTHRRNHWEKLVKNHLPTANVWERLFLPTANVWKKIVKDHFPTANVKCAL